MSTNYLQMLKKMDKMPIYLDLETLDGYCEYVLNDRNRTITYSNLANLKEFIDMMDPKILMTNDAKMARYYFLELYLEARLTKGITKRDLALQYVRDTIEPKYRKIVQREILNSIEPDQLTKKDIEFMNNMIFAQLNVQFMHQYQIGLTKMIEDVNNNDFGRNVTDCENAIQFFQVLLGELTKAQRRSKQENRFNLTDTTHFKAIITEAVERVLSGSTFLRTGFVGLDRMLNGGLENARTYNFIGATGGFKSGLLLNLMKTVKLYNKGKAGKDHNKRPTILFISQENNIWETIERIFGIFTNVGKMKNYKLEEVIGLLEAGGFCVVSDDDDIDIEFRYYGNMDIGVADIRGIVEELENEGKEVILCIQDYIERLRPPYMNVERRIQLSDISNQMHDLAIELDIPIITASQFNRSGVNTIESIRDNNQFDAGKSVGMKDISESFGMLKNFDANISIVIEYEPEEQRYYLSFRALKYRGDDSDSISYFLQPFIGTNTKIRLCDDVDLPQPMYKLSLADAAIVRMSEEQERLQEMKRQKRQLVSSIEVPDMLNNICDAFVEQVQNDQLKSDIKMEQLGKTSIMLQRGEDGFIHLNTKNSFIPYDKRHENKIKKIKANLLQRKVSA